MKAYLCDCTGIKKVVSHFSRFVGHIMTSELAYAVRGYGVNLTETSLKNAIEKYDNGKGQIMFQDFVDFMARKMTDPGLNEEDVLESFAVFDPKKSGKVDTKQLQDVMSKMGEPLTKKEFDAVMKDFEVDGDGNIDYNVFVKRLQEMYEVFS